MKCDGRPAGKTVPKPRKCDERPVEFPEKCQIWCFFSSPKMGKVTERPARLYRMLSLRVWQFIIFLPDSQLKVR